MQSSTQPKLNATTWAMLILLGAIWGGSFFFARIAVAEINPIVLVLERVAIAALALNLYLLFAGRWSALAYRPFGRFFLLALLNNVIPFSLIFAGQTQMGAGLASVLNATTPMWTLIVAALLTRDERLSWNKVAGILLGIAGTAVMIGPGLLAGLGGPLWAKFALLGSSLSYALALIFARRWLSGIPPEIVATGQLSASTIIMVPVVFLSFGPAALLAGSPPVWTAVLALALLSTAFAYILFFRILGAAGATNASLVTLIVPVSAVLLGVAFLGERLETFEAAGMVLIALGLITIDGRVISRLLRSQPSSGAV